MPKGFFTQGVAILLSRSVSIRSIKAALNERFSTDHIKENAEQWVFSGPSLLIRHRPEVDGVITVDIVDRRWPDDMGDPAVDATLFGAWTMGFFGPYTYPGNLERSAQQAWGYPEGRQAVEEHTAFIRIRSTYTYGAANDETPVLPADYDAFAELMEVTAIAQALLRLPEALCYFNPNGECLASGARIQELFERFEQSQLPPLELWSNVRLFNLPQEENWLLMDTVGMLQLDADDHEAVFNRRSHDPNEVANFLRNVSDYVYKNGPVIQDGDTINGPGSMDWQAFSLEEGLGNPPRSVLRWFPLDGNEIPSGLDPNN
jgi:hypothetical protein